jgi:signal transduction histidine kinase
MGNLKLKWKIFGFLLGFCTLLLGILWLFQTVFLTDMYKFIRRQELIRIIAEVESQLEKDFEYEDLVTLFRRIEIENDITVSLTNDFIMPPVYYSDQRGGRGNVRQEYIIEEKEITFQNGESVRLTFHAVIVPVDATVSTLRLQLYFITAAMIVLAVLLAIVIAKHVSKPIEEINKNAKILSKGDYDVRFNGSGFLEISELSDTLNTAASELSKVENLRRKLMANISQDLRTPLALIYGYAELMNDFPEEITAEQTRMIMGETKRLSTLVDDVFDVSRLETGNMTLNPSRFNLTESISGVIERNAKLLEKDRYLFNFEHEGEVYVNADEVKIMRAFYNLLVNAVNYSGEDKTVTVRQIISRDSVRIVVADNGEGIPPADLPYIWDRYYKVAQNHKRAVTGSGLGLSIVKKIVDLHGGSYGARSDVGRGSLFWFEIPTARQEI